MIARRRWHSMVGFSNAGSICFARHMPNLCENDLRILPVVRWELNAPIRLSLSPDAFRDFVSGAKWRPQP